MSALLNINADRSAFFIYHLFTGTQIGTYNLYWLAGQQFLKINDWSALFIYHLPIWQLGIFFTSDRSSTKYFRIMTGIDDIKDLRS